MSGIFVDVASSQIISLHSVEESTASLTSDAFFFANVVAGIRGVGGARLQGELRFLANILGTAPVLGLIFPLRFLCRSVLPKMPRKNPGSLVYGKNSTQHLSL